MQMFGSMTAYYVKEHKLGFVALCWLFINANFIGLTGAHA